MTRRVPWTPLLLLLLAAVRDASRPPAQSVRLEPQRVFNFVSGSFDIVVRPEHLSEVQVLLLRLPSELVSEDVEVLDARIQGLRDTPDYATWLQFEKYMDAVGNYSFVSGQKLLDSFSELIKPKFVQPSLLLMLRHWMLEHPPWQRIAEPVVALVAFQLPHQKFGPLSLELSYRLDGETLFSVLVYRMLNFHRSAKGFFLPVTSLKCYKKKPTACTKFSVIYSGYFFK